MSIADSQIKELDKEYCSHGDAVHYTDEPKIFRDCEGSFMFDSQDIPFLDLQMWYASCNLGYKNKRIADAVIDQINTLPQIGSRFLYDYKVLLSEKISKANEQRFGLKGRSQFNVGGAQAIEDVLKLLRNFTGKNSVFAFSGGYHGRTIGALGITSSHHYRENFGHFSEKASFTPFPYCFRCHYGKNCQDCDFYCVKQFEKNFESGYNSFYNPANGHTESGAFIAEPLQGAGGYIVPPKGYFKELKKVLDKYGILFVSDEIQMGYYRTGKLWSIEHFGIEPDVIAFGKSMTNGLNPLSGFWAKEELVNPEVWSAGRTHSTYCNNPIGVRAGYEVMTVFEEGDFEASIAEKGAKFLEGLKTLEAKYKKIGNVDGLGLALRIECTQEDGFTPNKELCALLVNEGLKGDLVHKGKKCGLILNDGGYFRNVISLVPPVTISNEEIDMAIDLLDQLFARF